MEETQQQKNLNEQPRFQTFKHELDLQPNRKEVHAHRSLYNTDHFKAALH